MKKELKQIMFKNVSDFNSLQSEVLNVSIFLPSTGFYPKGTIVKKLIAGYYPKNSDKGIDDCKLGLILTGKSTQIICIQIEDESLLGEDVKNALSEANTLISIESFQDFPEKEVVFSRNYFFKVNVGMNISKFLVDYTCSYSDGLRFVYGTPVKFLGLFYPRKKEKMNFSSNIEKIKNLPKIFRDLLTPVDAIEKFIFSPVSRVKLENINKCSNRTVLKLGKNLCFCKDLHMKQFKYSYTMSLSRKGEGGIFLFCPNEKCKSPLRKIADKLNSALAQDDLSVY